MRLPKGSVDIGESHDLPLLRQVLDTQFVTHSQLWEFLRHSGSERSRDSLGWRVRRLVGAGFLNRRRFAMVDREFIYSVAKAGVTYLQNGGVFYSGPADGPRITPDGYGVAHAIGLNRIRLRLVVNECLRRWQSEVEIRSHNELTKQPYQKDYDAIVTLRVGDKTSTVALEYERTAKAWAAYMEIRKAIEKEAKLDRFLYITTNSHIQEFLKQCFWQTKRHVYICLERDILRRSIAQVDVVDASTMRIYRLGEVL